MRLGFILVLLSFSQIVTALKSNSSATTHIFSTLFTAQDVRDYLSTDQGINDAITWCRQTSVTKVYLETYRSGYTADSNTLLHAKSIFEQNNFEVAGCVCTTNIGKPSTGWDIVSCYTNTTTQQQVKEVFTYAASLFDHIILDDFWFTDCQCNECNASLAASTVVVNNISTTFENTTDLSCTDEIQCMWKDMRRTLMSQVSQYNVLGAGQAVNPKVKFTVKYPTWYDSYQDKGYDTRVETDMFDAIWVGTESRSYTDPEFGGIPAYFGYFNMRWLQDVGGPKCGGGWYDTYGTDTLAYIEQARATILGGAPESFLFHYGDFLSGDGQADINVLRPIQPELLKVSQAVLARDPVGIGAYKPTNSHSGCIQDPADGGNTCNGENHVFDFIGMLGIPIIPVATFPSDFVSGFFSIHSLKDSSINQKLTTFINSGRPTLITDGLAARINTTINLNFSNVFILPVQGDPRTLISNPPNNIQQLRNTMLKPLGWAFQSPVVNVSLFPFSDGSWVLENFGNNSVVVNLNGKDWNVTGRGWIYNFLS